jgi:hypothetical protein
MLSADTKLKKLETRAQFIKQYKAAHAANMSKEQLAEVMGVKPDSIRRHRLVIQEAIGLDLPHLKSDTSPVSETIKKKFSTELGKLTKLQNKELDDVTEDEEQDIAKYNRLVITSAQNCTPIHENFFAALLNYCKVNKAKLLVIPYRYKNPTSIFSDKDDDWWDPKIIPYVMDSHIRVAKHLQILGHQKKQPTAIQPLYGLDGETGLDSAIVGHPKIQLKAIPTPSQSLPKILASTGAVTIPNYTDSSAGWRGHKHHSLAAAVVELDKKNDDIFHLRHVHADQQTGAFYDLDKFYTTNTVADSERASVLVTGDSHALFMDPDVEKATYTAADSIVSVLKPKHLVLHDVLDGYSISHHHKHNTIVRIGKHRFKCGNIEDELQITADFIDRVSVEGMQTHIVKSNHDEHFDRWLEECNPKEDLENSQFYHWMRYNLEKEIKQTRTGFSTVDPFVFWCSHPDRQRGLTNKHLVNILKRDQSLFINNIEFSFHGDRGSGGSRGSLKQFAKIGPKVVIGHSHTPGIYEGAYQVGLSAYMDLEYKTGCDSWLHSHVIVYPDGKRTILSVIRGKWRLAPSK